MRSIKSLLTGRTHMDADGSLNGCSYSLADFMFLFEGSYPVVFSSLRSCVDNKAAPG